MFDFFRAKPSITRVTEEANHSTEQCYRVSTEKGNKLNINQLIDILDKIPPKKGIYRLDLSGLSLKGQFADLLKKLIDLNIQIDYLDVSNTGLTDDCLFAAVAQMTDQSIRRKHYGCSVYNKVKYRLIELDQPNFSSINLSNNHLGYNGFFCLKLLQSIKLFTHKIDISDNKYLGRKYPQVQHSIALDYYDTLKDIYEYVNDGYFFSRKPNLYSLVPDLLQLYPKTEIVMDLKQSSTGLWPFIKDYIPVTKSLAIPLDEAIESSIEEVLQSPTIKMEHQRHYKRLIILADTVEITADACIDFDFLAIMANIITIKGKLQGTSNASLQIKARNQLTIDSNASLSASSIDVTSCHLFHFGNSDMMKGKWRIAGLFLHGSLLSPSSIKAKHLDIVASIYVQSPVAGLLSSGNSISWLSLNMGLSMARTNHALLNASLFADIPLLANMMQSPNAIYQLIPMISELLADIFYIKSQPELLASLSSKALLYVFRGLLVILSAGNPHIFSATMLLNIALQIPVLAKNFYDCYQHIQQQKPLQLANGDTSDFSNAIAAFNNEQPYESFLMAMELSSQTANLLVQGIRARYLFSQYWSGFQKNALSLKAFDVTSYVQDKFRRLNLIEINDIIATFTSLLPFPNLSSLLSINNLVTLLPEHENIALLDVSLLSFKTLANTRTTAALQMNLASVAQLSRENSQTFARISMKSHLSLSNSTIKNIYNIVENSPMTFLGQNSIETTHFINETGSSINGESLHLSYQNGSLANTNIGIKNLSLKTDNDMPADMINQMLERTGDYQNFCPENLKLDFYGEYHHTIKSLSSGYKLINICANLISVDVTINAADTQFILESKTDSAHINELVTAKLVVVISNKDIYLADKDNGLESHLANSDDPDFLKRQATINAEAIYLQAKNNIVNKGSALSKGTFSINAGNLVDNYGYLTASEGMMSVQAKKVDNHHASQENKGKHHRKTFTFVKAEIAGGWGNKGQNIGLIISADTIINDAATLSAKGLVRVSTKNGIENRTVTWQPDATKKHHGRRTYPQTQLYSGTVISGQEGNTEMNPEQIAILIHSNGSILDQAGNYITYNGGKICLSSPDINLQPVIMTYGASKTKKTCFSRTKITERHSLEVPATFLGTDEVILMSEKSIKGVVPLFIANNPDKKHLALISPIVELRVGIHQITKKISQTGLQATLTILGNIGINLIKQPQQESILDIKTFLNGFDELLRSKNLLEASKALYALSLSYPDAAKAAFDTLWSGAHFEYEKLLPKLTYPQLQAIFSQTKQSISSTQKGIGSIDTHSLTIIAETKCELQGIDVNAEEGYIKTPLLIHSGEPYTQSAKSRSKQINVSSSKHFGVAKRSEENSIQGRTPATMHIHHLHAEIGEWQATATNTTIDDLSGDIHLLSFSEDSTIVKRRSHYFTAATNTLVGAEQTNVHQSICQPSIFDIKSSSNMHINSVVNRASFFKSSGVIIDNYYELPYQVPIKTKNKTTGFLTTITAWSNPDLNTVTKIQGFGASFTFLTPHFFAQVRVRAPIEDHSIVEEIDVEPVKKQQPKPAKKIIKKDTVEEKSQQLFNTIVHEECTQKIDALRKWGFLSYADKLKKMTFKSSGKLTKSTVNTLSNAASKLISGETTEINTEFVIDTVIEFSYNYILFTIKELKYIFKAPDKIHDFYNDLFDEQMIDRHLSTWKHLQDNGFYWQNNPELSEQYYAFLQYQKSIISSHNYMYNKTFGAIKNIAVNTIKPIKNTAVKHIDEPRTFERDILQLGFTLIPNDHPLLPKETRKQILDNQQQRSDRAYAEKQKKAASTKKKPSIKAVITTHVNKLYEKGVFNPELLNNAFVLSQGANLVIPQEIQNQINDMEHRNRL